jgi:hypothetical protein
MGFTPLPGIMMGSRSWDIDPSILEYICTKKWITIAEATKELNKNSGLLWISWISSDSRDIEDAIKEGNEVIILGAWGCGAFKNPIEIVAKIFVELVKNYNFEIVEFALATKNDVRSSAFARALNQ